MRFFSFDKTGAGGGWRRTGTSEWKKSMDENDLLRQTNRQPGSKRSETQVFRVSKEVEPAKQAAEERERKEAAKAHRRAKQAGRAARNLPGSRPSRRVATTRSVKASRGGGSPLGGGGSRSGGSRSGGGLGPQGSGRSPLSGGGGRSSSSSGRSGKSPLGGKKIR